ncbi:hypothetical protein [Motilibacter aurantiacus]|uniref:hypothetical protein n=1 Tax=Motilibacter aurantiacus TaxID=2714955 RepID=UPI00140E5504|nr:hypothetical protein [Motilibacter aurantiacus]NHC46504.1 hypothetical protein [Motilibacter aurantiacus]
MTERAAPRLSATRWAAPPGRLALDREQVAGNPRWVARDRCGVVALAPTREALAPPLRLRRRT